MPRVKKLKFSELWTPEELDAKITCLFNELGIPKTSPAKTYYEKMATILNRCDSEKGYKIGTMEPKEIRLLNEYILFRHSRSQWPFSKTPCVPKDCPSIVAKGLQAARNMLHECEQKDFERARGKVNKIIQKRLQSSTLEQASTSSTNQDTSTIDHELSGINQQIVTPQSPVNLNAEDNLASIPQIAEENEAHQIDQECNEKESPTLEGQEKDHVDQKKEQESNEQAISAIEDQKEDQIDQQNEDECINQEISTIEGQEEGYIDEQKAQECTEQEISNIVDEEGTSKRFLLDEDTESLPDAESITTESAEDPKKQDETNQGQEDNLLQLYEYEGKTFEYYIVKKTDGKKVTRKEMNDILDSKMEKKHDGRATFYLCKAHLNCSKKPCQKKSNMTDHVFNEIFEVPCNYCNTVLHYYNNVSKHMKKCHLNDV